MSAQAAFYGSMAALDLVGGYFASQNIRATAQLNQEIAEANAEFAELDAYDAIVEGESLQARYQSVVDQTLSDQNAIAGLQGVDTGFGTAGAIQAEDSFIAELNLMEIEKRAREQSLGYENQAANLRTQGLLQRSQADIKADTALFQSVASATGKGITGYERSR